MSEQNKREFWIDENWAVGACDEMHLCVYDKEVDGIHVIEHSAYAALEAQLAECVALIERLARYEAAGRGQAGLQSMIIQACEVLAKVKK